jgi:hypothetical protein
MAAESNAQSFSYVPHYRTLTKSGQSHFSSLISHFLLFVSPCLAPTSLFIGVPDAIGEFVDNSLQATQDNLLQRNIQIHLDLNFYSGSSYLIIADDGKGMTVEELKRFARYSDAKEYSSNSQENPTNISMFGVGSKEAGFYLGERLHVVTNSSQLNDKYLELVLDENEMEQKYRNEENVCLSLLCHLTPSLSLCLSSLSFKPHFLFLSVSVSSLLLLHCRFIKANILPNQLANQVLSGAPPATLTKLKNFEESMRRDAFPSQ